MRNEYLIIKKLEKLEDLAALEEGNIVRIVSKAYRDIGLIVYERQNPNTIEFLNITGIWPTISEWSIDKKLLGIKNGMLLLPHFKDVKTECYKTNDKSDKYTKKREIIERSGLLPGYIWEELAGKKE